MSEQEFIAAMSASGVECRDSIVADGQIHRFSTNGNKNKKNGWYVFYGNAGAFGDWSLDINKKWHSSNSNLSAAEEEKLQKHIDQAKAVAERERLENHKIVAEEAKLIISNLKPATTSPYLERKQVKAFGLYSGSGNIAIPLYDIDHKLWSIQYINDDGSKMFLKGGRKKGCFFTIGELSNGGPIYICEGYSTGASIFEAVGGAVVITFDAGNIDSVVAAIRDKYPDSQITICADNDQWKERNIGKEKAEAASAKYNCKLAIPEFKAENHDKKPSDFNDLHVLCGLDEVRKQLTNNIKNAPGYIIPKHFQVSDKGVFFIDFDDEKPAIKLSSKLEITSYTHDENDCNHGLLLEWQSERTGHYHKWAMPCRMLAGDGVEIREKLLDEGLILTPGRKAREKFLEYIQSVKPERKALSLSRIGWHGNSFALPDIVYPKTEDMVLQSEGASFESFKVSGTLQDWQENVARYASGNSRLIFALSTAFSAPLLNLTNSESGVVHFVGQSSKGKTSALRIAGSVWGGGGENGFIKQWRSTANAQEAMAELHRDCLLPLDELGQADSKTVGETVYMLANNQGKKRMKSSAILKRTYEWRVLVLSSGEVTLETKMQEAGKKAYAGMEVRFINIPAEVEGAHGVFENLHGFASGHEFSKNLQEGCNKYYGTAIRFFLENLADNTDGLVDIIDKLQQDFSADNITNNVSGQIKRVVGRFSLIAAAGELAIAMGILPLNVGDAVRASKKCFNDWLASRGSTDNLESEKGIAQIRAYLERYGTSKFITLDEFGKESSNNNRPIERIGYRQLEEGVYHYYILPEAYKSELCKGYDPRVMTRVLVERGYLVKSSDGRNQVSKTFPHESKQRVYHISPAIFGRR